MCTNRDQSQRRIWSKLTTINSFHVTLFTTTKLVMDCHNRTHFEIDDG